MKTLTTVRESDQAYGRVEAFLHVASYTIAKAFQDVEFLLDAKNRWKEFGHKDVNEFLGSFSFKAIEANIETRKRLANKIQALQPKASNRQIAKTVGLKKDMVRRGAFAPPAAGKTKQKQSQGGANAPRLSGDQAAKTVERAERIKDRQNNVAGRVAKVGFDAAKLGKYSIILADPPWDDDFGANRRSTENHYPTMKIEEICALPVSEIAHDQAMLFMWATSPMLEPALATVKSWGFEYRTQMVWVKPSIGTGQYVRQRHELLLVCRRGDHPAPDATLLPGSIIEAPRGEHSEKPGVFFEIIEKMYPGAARIELFRRGQPRDGWAAWGAEVQQAAE